VDGDLLHLALVAVEGGINLAVFAALLALVALNRAAIRLYWRTAALVGLAILCLSLPQYAATLFFLDSSTLASELGLPGDEGGVAVKFGIGLGMLLGLGTSLLQAGWLVLVSGVALAEWSRLRDDACPVLLRRSVPVRALVLAMLLGVVASVISTLLFQRWGVDAGRSLEYLDRFFPQLSSAGVATRMAVALPFVTSAAISEEIVFRGALLGFLLRAGGERRWVVIAATVLVALLWSLLHLTATGAPLIKLTQIFLLGLAFSELARRSCLEAALVAHLALNLTGVLLVAILGL